MKVLITAGATVTPIDKVRIITNVFKGRTGANIAQYFAKMGAQVTIITSNPDLLRKRGRRIKVTSRPVLLRKHRRKITVLSYRTFDDLAKVMEEEITTGQYDVIIHSAAVSDYEVAGVYYKNETEKLVDIDASGKISSTHKEMFLKLTPTIKLVDLIRKPWGFKGTLIKFKLQVDMSDEALLEIANKSRAVSDADFIVANCKEWFDKYAYIVDRSGDVKKVSRKNLAVELYGRVTT